MFEGAEFSGIMLKISGSTIQNLILRNVIPVTLLFSSIAYRHYIKENDVEISTS